MFYFDFDYDTCGSSRYNTYSFSLFVYFMFWFLNAYTILFYCSLQCTFILDLSFMWFAVSKNWCWWWLIMRGLSLRDWLERLRTIFDFVGENVRVCMMMV